MQSLLIRKKCSVIFVYFHPMPTFDFNSKEFKKFQNFRNFSKVCLFYFKYLRENCVKLLLLLVQNRIKFHLHIPTVPITFLNKQVRKSE